jgi:hypothetical protein
MSKFSFTGPDGKIFNLSGPANLTREQAEAIFKQQTQTGSLVGLDVGKALSAATQAAGGLTSALSSATQTLSKAGLPGASDLNSIAAKLGPGAGAALSQVQTALTGAAGLASKVIGSDAGAALAAVRSAGTTIGLPSVDSVLAQGTAITGIVNQVGSVASATVNKLKTVLNTSVTNGINVADMVKQGTVPAIPGLSSGTTQAAMSQLTKIVGQTADQISDVAGLGKFGLDAKQLETAGYIKLGTSSKYSAENLANILKSPTVWTGKDNVKGLENVLGNDALQNKIQGGLMATGLAALKTQGVPVDSLNPQALAGLANNAAKSVSTTLDVLKGVPTVPPNVKQAFDTVTRDSAFAAKLAETKVEAPVLQEVVPTPAENTVNTETLDAAASRVVGNEKVPAVTSGKSPGYNQVLAAFNWLSGLSTQLIALENKIAKYKQQDSITQSEWEVLNNEFQLIRIEFNSKNLQFQTEAANAIDNLSSGSDKRFLGQKFEDFKALLIRFAALGKSNKADIGQLANKIVG